MNDKDHKGQNQDLNQPEDPDNHNMSRRDIVKGLATVPVLGAFAYGYYRKRKYERQLKSSILQELNMPDHQPDEPEKKGSNTKIRIGLVGFGIRGPQLAKAAGFLHPGDVEKLKNAEIENSRDKRHQEFIEQEDLNIEITAVCDIFTVYAKKAQETGANRSREGEGATLADKPVIFKNYRELVAADFVDAIIIATPDHWHAPITIEAARAGKHVYCEKPLSWSVSETYDVRNAIRESGIVFQLGHQNRQTEAYIKAKEAILNNVLGPVNLIEVTTNRNDPNGAWVYDIHPEAGPETIDWEQFIGQAPWHDFSLERFFRWRCWWDYSTGLSGDLLTHEYDAMNQILGFGIPDSAVSSGGIYFFKDGRTVPDVLHTVFEFEKQNLTMMYSATLASSKSRGRVIMGHDASMEIGNSMMIYADPQSTKYKEKIKDGIIDTSLPILSFTPGKKSVDAITSATEQYFAGRGLLYTYRGGKRVDTSHLHIREWLSCIRDGGTPSCNIDQAFEEAITAHMGTMAFREGRRVQWDRENEKIV
ncbi:MAG TPA: Gfo/Idh/MocA family oxidoreductase [Bacteroidales bacterium]|nr:Gfo/Idh/MocA family oxidoreductase [Bacteroidales bacterium]